MKALLDNTTFAAFSVSQGLKALVDTAANASVAYGNVKDLTRS